MASPFVGLIRDRCVQARGSHKETFPEAAVLFLRRQEPRNYFTFRVSGSASVSLLREERWQVLSLRQGRRKVLLLHARLYLLPIPFTHQLFRARRSQIGLGLVELAIRGGDVARALLLFLSRLFYRNRLFGCLFRCGFASTCPASENHRHRYHGKT